MMADIEALKRALVNADKAGDVEAARKLAAAIQSAQQPAPAPSDHQSQFDQLPWYMKAAQAADDTVRNFANTITMGYADKLASAAGGTPLEEERQKSSEARERAGSAAIATDILAMAAPGTAASKAVGTAVPALSGTRLLPTMAREGIAGAGIGGLTAAGNDMSITEGMLYGLGGGAIGGAAGKYMGEGLDWLSSKLGVGKGILSSEVQPRMSLEQQTATKNAAYDDILRSGIDYAPNDAAALAGNLDSALKTNRADPVLHPRATRVNEILQERLNSGQPLPLMDVDDLRKIVNRDVVGPGGESYMGSQMRNVLDNFVDNTTPRGGGTARASELVRTAREANRKLQVREMVEEAVRKTGNSASGPGSLAKYRSLLDNNIEGMTAKEIKLLEDIVKGANWEDRIGRWTSGTLGRLGSFGSGASAAGIASGGNPAIAALGGIGAMLIPPITKKGVQRSTQRSVEALLDELGGGVFNPALIRRLAPGAAGGAGASNATRSEAERRRKRRRNKKN